MTAVATAATVAVVTAVPVEATATTQQSKPANKSQLYKQTAALRLKGGCSIMRGLALENPDATDAAAGSALVRVVKQHALVEVDHSGVSVLAYGRCPVVSFTS